MRTTGERVGRLAARGVVVAVAAVAAVFTMLPTAAGDDVGTQSAGSGARSGDFTLDDVSDILARQADNGVLKVYPHSGTFNGAATYLPSVTINTGWAGMRWIGQGDMNGDGNPDVVYIDQNNVMWVAPHSGAWSGTGTLTGAVAIASGWEITDLVTTGDFNDDGLDDVIARRVGTDLTYLYLNNGLNGFNTLTNAQSGFAGTANDIEQILADFNFDGYADLLSIRNDGVMVLWDPAQGITYTVSYGWGGFDAFVATDVNDDGALDILARRTSDGTLLAYRHSGLWRPTVGGNAFDTFTPGVGIGTGWHTNNVIS